MSQTLASWKTKQVGNTVIKFQLNNIWVAELKKTWTWKLTEKALVSMTQ